MNIFWKCTSLNISKCNFSSVIYIAKRLIWTTLKAIFSIFTFFTPSDSRFSNTCISANYLFSFQIMYTSKLQNINPYDWFCGSGSHTANAEYKLTTNIKYQEFNSSRHM